MWTKTTLSALTAIALLTLIGCATKPAGPAAGESPQAAAEPAPPGGAQLWAENCSRCHNLRPPQSYDDAQWQTVVHHMRLRANLDGSEAKLIAEFLQASH
jgi:cytochrome c5